MRSEAQVRAEAKYNAKLKQVCIKLNPDKDADIIEWLGRKSMKAVYIKNLIREDMKTWNRMTHL